MRASKKDILNMYQIREEFRVLKKKRLLTKRGVCRCDQKEMKKRRYSFHVDVAIVVDVTIREVHIVLSVIV